LSSTENGGAPFLSLGTGMLFFLAYLIRSLLDTKSQSRHGAIILIFGLK